MDRREQIKLELWCQALSNGNTMRFRALGGSMSPFIKNGSILSIKPTDRIFTGDVILYKGKNGIIVHRVIHRKNIDGNIFFVAKGDNLRHPDTLVCPSDILGKVVKVESSRSKINLDSFLRRLLNYAVAMASPILLPVILSFLMKIRVMLRQR